MPNRFLPIGQGTDMDTFIKMTNRNFAELDNETYIKVFYGAGGKPAVMQGKLSHGFYGEAKLREDGTVWKLSAYNPDYPDGVEIHTKDGQDAYTVLGY